MTINGAGRRLLLACALLAFPVAATGQASATRIGVGFAANAPRQMLGGAVHVTTSALAGFGLYLDYKVDPASPGRASSLQEMTAQEAEDAYGDDVFRDGDSWRNINVALAFTVSTDFIIYAGAGRAERTWYVEYQDETGTRGKHGFYWTEDPTRSRTLVNALVGGFFGISERLSLHFGLESSPRGATVGASYLFSF